MFELVGDDGATMTIRKVSPSSRYYDRTAPVEVFVNGHGGQEDANYIFLSWAEVDETIDALQNLRRTYYKKAA